MSQPDLNERDREVLRLVHQYEPARASTIREALHWADRNQDIHYRWSKLEDAGLIYLEEIPDDSVPINPKEAKITREGHEEIEQHLESEQPRTAEERLERIEKQLSAMRQTYGRVKQRIVRVEDRLEKLEELHEEDAESLHEELQHIKRAIDGPTIDADELQFGDD